MPHRKNEKTFVLVSGAGDGLASWLENITEVINYLREVIRPAL
jgi:hypothetical protein